MSVPPALSPIQGPALPGAPDEPVLDAHDIQGNVLVGFNKNHQAFLFLEITDAASAKRWLREIIPTIATVEETLAFRRLFRAMRNRRGEEAAGLVATWLNIAFTGSGIEKLTSAAEADKFPSDAFKLGMAARAGILGDPTDDKGNPKGWVVGGADQTLDVLVIVASDSREALRKEVKRVKDLITNIRGDSPTRSDKGGLQMLYEEEGETLPGNLVGHEHFSFKDGISQPGIRGRVSPAPLDFLTPRLIDSQDPLAMTYARPGQPLVWPGQFVLGEKYPLQNPFNVVQPQLNTPPTPVWAANGSFLVFRRLRQDVASFWRFMNETAESLTMKYSALAGLNAERLASLFIGRWPSGVPIMREPAADNPDLASHMIAVNNFNFTNATNPVRLIPSAAEPPDNFPLAPADSEGLRCPFAAHIRKVNPRDDTTELGGPERTLLKRILRRGIPFGRPLANPLRAGKDKGERGLLFVSYQASIEEQFEFLMTDWADSTANPRSYVSQIGDQPAGHDPIIGQQPTGARQRSFVLRVDGQTFETIALPSDFVIPTGGGYFFAPSITALKTVLSV
jgi:Dyp-type peroxidase family